MKNMFVYGSLKKGFFNHSFISENPQNRLIRKGFILGYKLYLLCSYPGIRPSSSDDKVFVELYRLTDESFERIDLLEKRANYAAVKVEDDAGKEGTVYVYNGEFNEKNLVLFGNWTKNNEKLNIIPMEDSK